MYGYLKKTDWTEINNTWKKVSQETVVPNKQSDVLREIETNIELDNLMEQKHYCERY
jgi:hypothetical protein